jgi:hypothetical protein
MGHCVRACMSCAVRVHALVQLIVERVDTSPAYAELLDDCKKARAVKIGYLGIHHVYRTESFGCQKSDNRLYRYVILHLS